MNPVRMNVDDQTATLLTELSDVLTACLGDTVKDLVNRDELKRQLGDVEAHISAALGKTRDTLQESLETIKLSLEAMHAKVDIQTSTTEQTSSAISLLANSNYDQLKNSLTLLESVMAYIGKIETDTSQLKDDANNVTKRLDVLETNISRLVDQLTRLNRPWWHKLLG